MAFLFSCVDVEKKYEDYRINMETKHLGKVEYKTLSNGNYVQRYSSVKGYSDLGLSGLYENESEMTYCVWICPEELKNAPIIDNFSNVLWLKKDGTVRFTYAYRLDKGGKLNSYTVTTTSKCEINNWSFISVVYKKNNYLKIYFNGKLENQVEVKFPYGQYNTFSSYYVSKTDHDKKNFFMGMIDTEKIKIYNKEMLSGDVKGYYNQTKKGYK